jgi:hypothetical protein
MSSAKSAANSVIDQMKPSYRSAIIGFVASAKVRQWSVIFDSENVNSEWGRVFWNGKRTGDSGVTVIAYVTGTPFLIISSKSSSVWALKNANQNLISSSPSVGFGNFLTLNSA